MDAGKTAWRSKAPRWGVQLHAVHHFHCYAPRYAMAAAAGWQQHDTHPPDVLLGGVGGGHPAAGGEGAVLRLRSGAVGRGSGLLLGAAPLDHAVRVVDLCAGLLSQQRQ
jgi:hypothetical protein